MTIQRFRIDPGKLGIVHARLQAELGRILTWAELAEMMDITPHTLSNIRHRRTAGSLDTALKLAEVAREHGLNVSIEDLIMVPPSSV